MISIALPLIVLGAALAAPELHLAHLSAPMPPGENSGAQAIKLAAAANEHEAFYLRVVNDESPRTLQSIEISWNGDLKTVPTIYIVTPDPARPIAGAEALTPFDDPVALEPFAPRDFVVAVKLPETAKPGNFSGNIHVRFDQEKSERAPIRLEVFDFIIPDEPSLPVLFGLDREAIRRSANLSEALDDWATLYDALAGLRTGFAVWPQRHPVNEMFYDYRDLDLIKEHMAYAVKTAHLPAMEFGGRPGELMAGWPPPVGNSPQDPLQLLITNIMTSLYELGWTRPSVLIPDLVPPRDGWPGIRQQLSRIHRADEIVTRLIPGPLHPYFERYTDIWAFPSSTPPAAMSLLRRGLSIVRFSPPAGTAVTGTPGALDDTGAYLTEPGDALDGCEFTTWRLAPESPETSGELEVSFESVLHIDQVALIRPPGGGQATITVETAYNPGAFTEATVRWKKSNHLSEGESEIWLGEFKHPRDCRAIRFHIAGDASGDIQIAEVLFNQDGRTVVNSSIEPVSPWLNVRTGKNIWLESQVPGRAWRMLPWYCWQRDFRGILGAELTPDPENGGTRLIAAGPGGLFPTVALLHLRDGLEDYEYLVRYWQDVSDKKISPPGHVRPGWTELPPSVQNIAQVNQAGDLLAEDRLQMGRLLSGKALVTKNFGP